MRHPLFFLLFAVACILGSGCVSPDAAGFEQQVHKWVPLGTPVADAQKAMEKHKFECVLSDKHPENPLSEATLSCTRKTGALAAIADWVAEFDIRDGKVAAYGHIDL